jgi:hypothetical protein
MNKYLLLSAAAAIAGHPGDAGASSFATKTLCDSNGQPVVQFIKNGDVYNARYLDGSSAIGIGIAGKTTGIGRHVFVSDNYGFSSYTAIANDFSLPLKTGGTWNLWIEFSGTTGFVANTTSYTVCNTAGTKPRRRSMIARTNLLIEQISAATRAAKGK